MKLALATTPHVSRGCAFCLRSRLAEQDFCSICWYAIPEYMRTKRTTKQNVEYLTGKFTSIRRFGGGKKR